LLVKAPPALIKRDLLSAFPPERPCLIGLSGGRDSIALLHSLLDLGYGNLIVCHLNHQLRGKASEADARFVEKLASKLGLDLAIGTANVSVLAAKNKLSIETAGRAARYAFFAKVAKREKCKTIFLGHHADDLVETFLINLFRGAGTTGLSAMRAATMRRVDKVDLVLVRPLLALWRADIDKYIRRHRLKFREDASNRNLVPLRNRIRRQVIPYLEKNLDRNVRRNIWRTAMIASDEEDFFESLLPENFSHLSAVAIEPLREMSVALQRRMLHKWLRGAAVSDIGFDLIERVRSLLDTGGGVAKTNLPRNRHVRRRAKKLFIEG